MSFNGSGTFVINTAGQPVVSGTVISSTAFNALTADLATGLSTCITKDGQTTVTANIPFGNNKITGLGAGTAAADAANLSQVQSTVAKLINSVSGADTITGTMSPNLAAYATGQMFYFVAVGANTGAVTINIDSLGAKNITRDGTTALAAGDIQSGEICVIVYDGTQFQLVNGASQSASIVTENLTVNKATVLNESGGDNDTRIEGDTDANLFFVDASTDNVGIGTSSPGAKLDVSTSGNFSAFFTNGVTNQWAVKVIQSGSTELQLSPAITLNNGPSIRSVTSGGVAYAPLTLDGSTITLKYGGTTGLLLDSAGNLGLGVTPSAWQSTRRVIQVGANGGALWGINSGAGTCFLSNNAYFDGTNFKYINTANATYYAQASDGKHEWHVSASGTAGNNITSFNQAMTLDASGNLLINATSNSEGARLKVDNGYVLIKESGGADVYLRSAYSGGIAAIQVSSNSPLAFATNNTERARITSDGDFLVGATATIASERLTVIKSIADWLIYFRNTASAGPAGIRLNYSAASPNGTGNEFLYCDDSTTARATIRSNGGIANYQGNDVNLSDERVKTDIAPLGSMWDKFKAIEIVTFKYKDQTHDDDNIGVIAQQVESVAPEFIDVDGFGETPEDGVPLKTVYTTDLYHAAIKALQEAMTRIEQLEAEVKAMKEAAP